MDANIPTFLYFLFGGLFLIGLVATIGGFLHHRRERLLTHEERMKALELGRQMPDDAATARIKAAFGVSSSGDKAEESDSLARKCFSTALWVAFWGFLAASQGGWVNHSIAIAIAASVAVIGVTAFICGTILAARSPAKPSGTSHAKEHFEADAFDVVSRRG
jgi:hypothetical protein